MSGFYYVVTPPKTNPYLLVIENWYPSYIMSIVVCSSQQNDHRQCIRTMYVRILLCCCSTQDKPVSYSNRKLESYLPNVLMFVAPSRMITGNVSGPCMSGFYYVVALPKTNLYLLVIENWNPTYIMSIVVCSSRQNDNRQCIRTMYVRILLCYCSTQDKPVSSSNRKLVSFLLNVYCCL